MSYLHHHSAPIRRSAYRPDGEAILFQSDHSTRPRPLSMRTLPPMEMSSPLRSHPVIPDRLHSARQAATASGGRAVRHSASLPAATTAKSHVQSSHAATKTHQAEHEHGHFTQAAAVRDVIAVDIPHTTNANCMAFATRDKLPARSRSVLLSRGGVGRQWLRELFGPAKKTRKMVGGTKRSDEAGLEETKKQQQSLTSDGLRSDHGHHLHAPVVILSSGATNHHHTRPRPSRASNARRRPGSPMRSGPEWSGQRRRPRSGTLGQQARDDVNLAGLGGGETTSGDRQRPGNLPSSLDDASNDVGVGQARIGRRVRERPTTVDVGDAASRVARGSVGALGRLGRSAGQLATASRSTPTTVPTPTTTAGSPTPGKTGRTGADDAEARLGQCMSSMATQLLRECMQERLREARALELPATWLTVDEAGLLSWEGCSPRGDDTGSIA